MTTSLTQYSAEYMAIVADRLTLKSLKIVLTMTKL